MASVVVDEGREWISEKVLDNHVDGQFYIVAVGDGTTSPSSSDTSLENELYRANSDDSNCSIQDTSNTGEIKCRITVSGGTEVPAGSDLSEFGVFASDGSTLIYREVRDTAVTVQSGDRKTFEFTLDVQDG